MFIYTIKASSIKFFAVLLLSVAALVTLIAVIPEYDSTGDMAVVATDYADIKTNEDRVGFIEQFGYTVNAENYETESVIIPKNSMRLHRYNDIHAHKGLILRLPR